MAGKEQCQEVSLEQKLELIDEELHKLHMFCVNSGYSPTQIKTFAEPFSEKLRLASRKKWIKRFVGVCVLFIASVFLLRLDSIEKFLCGVGRMAAIQVMPIYDWSRLYYTECLIDNPLHDPQTIVRIEDCNVCENIKTIERIKNVKEADIIQKYIKQDKAVIVTDALKYNERHKFTVEYLNQIFKESMYESCDFQSNIKVQGHRSFLKQVAAVEHAEYFAHWRNCFVEPAKEFRHHFKRPYFFSSVVELVETNWIFISYNYTSKLPKPMLVDGPLMMLMQMKGQIKIDIIPDKLCSDICHDITTVLNEGEILLVPDFLWMVDYYPIGKDENVGIGVTGNFD